jgi:hypothetical protein
MQLLSEKIKAQFNQKEAPIIRGFFYFYKSVIAIQ